MLRIILISLICLSIFIYTSPVSAATITKLHYHHVYTSRTDIIPNLPSAYSSFIRSEFLPDYTIASGQEIRARYFEVTTPPLPGVGPPGYPILYTDVQNDEVNFIHASNPAGLTVQKGVNEFVINWKYDERYSDPISLTYDLYRLKGLSLSLGPMWDPAWENLAWTKVKTFPASSYLPGTRFVYEDTDLNSDDANGGTTCYMVKTINGSTDTFYALPVCKKYSQESLQSAFYFTYGRSEKLSQHDNSPIDSSGNIIAIRDHTILDPSILNADNTYQITAGIKSLTQFSDPKVIVYGFTNNPLAFWNITGIQMMTGFTELQRTPMTITTDGAQIQFTLRRPYALYTGKNITDDPVFRIRAVDGNGVEQIYPHDGYLTIHPNNRIQNRVWSGYPVNPASIEWLAKIIDMGKDMLGKGYSTIFFDEWRPEKFALETVGWPYEAPNLEFVYPTGFSTDPNFTDPFTQALDRLGTSLSAGLPGMTFIGNTLNNYRSAQTIRTLQSIHGGLYEGCMHNASIPGKLTGQNLTDILNLIDTVLGQDKKVICLAKYKEYSVTVDPFNPDDRLYSLGAYLLVAQNKTTGNTYFGHSELNPGTTGNPNYFLEYFIDIGDPSSARTSIGTYFWKRIFSNGEIYVNADTTNKSITLNTNMYQLTIVNEQVIRYPGGNIQSVNPGTVKSILIPAGSQLTIPAAGSLILTKNDQTHSILPELLSNWLMNTFDQNGDNSVNSFDFAKLL